MFWRFEIKAVYSSTRLWGVVGGGFRHREVSHSICQWVTPSSFTRVDRCNSSSNTAAAFTDARSIPQSNTEYLTTVHLLYLGNTRGQPCTPITPITPPTLSFPPNPSAWINLFTVYVVNTLKTTTLMSKQNWRFNHAWITVPVGTIWVDFWLTRTVRFHLWNYTVSSLHKYKTVVLIKRKFFEFSSQQSL